MSSASARKPWPGGGRASENATDIVLSAARGFSAEERGVSFRILDFPHLGTLTAEGAGYEKDAIARLTDVELGAWLADRSFEPVRAGMPRAELELMAMRVRKLPCDTEALGCAHEAFLASATTLSPADEDALTDEIAASAADAREDVLLRQLDAFLVRGTAVWLCGLSKHELNGRVGVVAGERTGGELGPGSRYPVELRDLARPDVPSCERLAVRPVNLRPGQPPGALSGDDASSPNKCPNDGSPDPSRSKPDSVESALTDTLGADVAGLVLEKTFASAVAAVDAEIAEEEADDAGGGQWRAWHEWIAQRVCYGSLLAGKDGTGGGLCMRCRVAWYSSPAEQRAHWAVHKKVCVPPDLAKVGSMDSATCVSRLMAALRRSPPPADTAALVYRLGHLLKTDQVDEAGDLGMKLHGFARGVMAAYGTEQWEILWAVPGWPQVMLHEPLLASGLLRRARVERAIGRAPTAEEEEEHDLERAYGDKGAYEFCFLHYNLLLGAGYAGESIGMCSAHDGASAQPRQSPVGEAAQRRAMLLWLDPGVRESCGDAMGPAASFALSYFTASDHVERATLLASGVGQACFDEMSMSGAGAARYARALLRSLGSKDWHVLAHGMLQNESGARPVLTMAATAAVSLALDSLSYLHEHEGDRDGYLSRWEDGDAHMLEQIVGGCLQVGVARMGPLSAEQKWRRTVLLRTRLLQLGAGRNDEADDAEGSGYDARHWGEVSARGTVRLGATASADSTALPASTGAPRVPKVPDIGSRALCSWALEQRAVLEATDATALCEQLRKFLSWNVFSSEVVQTHYRKCMSAEEWQKQWASSIARFGSKKKKAKSTNPD